MTENSEVPEEESIRAPWFRVHAQPGRPQPDDAFEGGLFGRYPNKTVVGGENLIRAFAGCWMIVYDTYSWRLSVS